MVSRAALIRAANLDDLEPRIERVGPFSWDATKMDVWLSADGKSITAVTIKK